MPPAVIAALISAMGSVAGGVLNRDQGSPLTQTQDKQNNIIDLIMQAIEGQGPLAGLVQGDEDAFKKSVSDPLMNQFNNQTAPNIQQSFIKNRLQGGTGLDDALARSGIDVQDNINSQFMNFQQQGNNNLINLLQNALGANANVATPGQSALQGGASELINFLSKFDSSKLFGSGSGNNVDDLTGGLNRSGNKGNFTGSSTGLSRTGNKEDFGR